MRAVLSAAAGRRPDCTGHSFPSPLLAAIRKHASQLAAVTSLGRGRYELRLNSGWSWTDLRTAERIAPSVDDAISTLAKIERHASP